MIYALILPNFYFCSQQNNDDIKAQTLNDKNNPIRSTAAGKNVNPADKGVINFFCGRGCIPCNRVAPAVNAVAKKYKLKLNTYEVWYDDKNRELLLNMARERNTDVKGVPVVIIENDVYPGVEKILRLEDFITKYLK